ncbi:protein FAR1-RELATED SEQUENCE 5-like [Helianthus annuus]|uniref:protein FAR1-RELATED SEQUENCE 5-like n=1 Tax=Helianthus annuus TaxID=4232 RepID=UPI001652DB9D|nr:protein FAR1-RELATED SEQUENCE 5-like [Helianthus annuus]
MRFSLFGNKTCDFAIEHAIFRSSVIGFDSIVFSIDPQSSTARNTDVDFEEARLIGDQVQLSAYQKVTINDVLNPEPANPNRNANTSGVNECSNDEKIYTPEVEPSAIPVVGMQFTSIEQAYVFYQTYAKLAEGHKPLFIDDAYSKSKKPFKSRNRGTIRTGCKAQLMICTVDGRSYTVKKFVDGHNHKFVCPHDIHMLLAYRQLSDVQEEMIWELGTLNLGPVKAFHILRKCYDGFDNVGATVDDCKNFRNRIKSYIGEYDADMVINRLTDEKQYLVDFSFEYSVDEDKRLTGLFWANGLCKRNFMVFGDVISFDATFKTNKYKMVFVPFTGIDNHCRNVNLGAGLLASESIDSYKWLLNSFVKPFGRQPKVVVTDQDPAMKLGLVGHELCNNDDFKRRMCDIVWTDSIEPEEFERQWKLVMIEYGLTENKWIDDMFSMRYMWIPAFYRHEPMSGLMRTTSRSESENHFFARFNHRKNDHISRYTEPDDWSKTTLEKDAAKIYTRSIFFYQQTEIYGTITECLPMDTKIEGPQIKISLKDFKAHGDGLLERWTKDVVPNELNAMFDVKVGDKDEQHKAKQIACEIIYTGEYLVSNLISDPYQLVLVRDQTKQIKEKVDQSRIIKQLDPKLKKDPRHKANEVEDDEEEDEFEDYSGGSDDGSEEDEWEEVSDEED